MAGGYALRPPPACVACLSIYIRERWRNLIQLPAATDSCDDGIGEEEDMGVLHRRGIVAAAAVVAFNLVMLVLAAMGSSPMEAPFLVAWITGDAVLSVAGLFLTERP